MINIENNVKLAPYTTFRIGGPAKHFVAVDNEEGLTDAVGFAKKNNLPILVIGGGSNLLVSDAGFNGLVIRIEMKGIRFGVRSGDSGYEYVYASAGEDWENFVGCVVEKGLYGIENLSSIPGTVGASPVQNIGAYGAEASDCIETVRVLDTSDMNFKELSKAECRFSYRDSLFKHEKGRYIITGVIFKLSKKGKTDISYRDLREYFEGGDGKTQESQARKPGRKIGQKKDLPSLKEVREAVIEIRKNKLPDWTAWGTAGSFFKNPIISVEHWKRLKSKYPELPGYPEPDGKVKVSLAWILDKLCDARGLACGNVGTYEKQALVIVVKPGATANEVIDFAGHLMRCVKEKTEIEIEGEVEWAVA